MQRLPPLGTKEHERVSLRLCVCPVYYDSRTYGTHTHTHARTHTPLVVVRLLRRVAAVLQQQPQYVLWRQSLLIYARKSSTLLS
jgi:hypothetical protein